MAISYDPYERGHKIHPCDSCKRFVSKRQFLKWQSTWIFSDDPEIRDPLLCPGCGGNYG